MMLCSIMLLFSHSHNCNHTFSRSLAASNSTSTRTSIDLWRQLQEPAISMIRTKLRTLTRERQLQRVMRMPRDVHARGPDPELEARESRS